MYIISQYLVFFKLILMEILHKILSEIFTSHAAEDFVFLYY